MGVKPDVTRDVALKHAKEDYLTEMKKLRSEYRERKYSAENAYTSIRNHVWKEFWEDVG